MKTTGTYNYVAVAVGLFCIMSVIQAGPRRTYCSVHTDCVAPFGCFGDSCTHPCNNSLDEHVHCQLMNDVWIFTCSLGYQFQSDARSCQPMGVIECKDDSHCSSSMICYGEICVNPCDAWPTPHTDCKVENHKTTRTCHAGYEHRRGMKRCFPIM